MNRLSYETYANVFSVVYMVLMTNLLLLVTALPFVLLLVTTDPARSWPLLAVAGALAAPAITAAFTVFREHSIGSTTVARDFVKGLRNTWRRALLLGVALVAVVAVLLADVRTVARMDFAVFAIPTLGVLLVLSLFVALHALVVISERPGARLRDALRASVLLSVRRWYLSLASIAVLVLQIVLFTSLPALAVGVTASGALFLAWSNSRYTMRPVLDVDAVPAS